MFSPTQRQFMLKPDDELEARPKTNYNVNTGLIQPLT